MKRIDDENGLPDVSVGTMFSLGVLCCRITRRPGYIEMHLVRVADGHIILSVREYPEAGWDQQVAAYEGEGKLIELLLDLEVSSGTIW